MAEQGSALDWARRVDLSRPVSLGDAEDRIRVDAGLEQHDSCVRVIAEGIAWLAPMVALAIFLTSGTRVLEMEPVPAAVAVPVSGALFAVGLLGPLLALLRWHRRGRRRSGLTVGTTVLSLALGLAGGLAMTLVAGRDGVEPGAWLIAPWALAALSALALGVQLAASAPPADPAAQRAQEQELVRRRTEVLAALRDRGAIDDATRARAEAMPFGALGALDRERRGSE